LDPFRHLPQLREIVENPHLSELRVTPEKLLEWDRHAAERGAPADWRLSDQEREERRHQTLARRDRDEDLWVFAFGSLMWDPGIHFEEIRLARATGFQRSFCIRTEMARGNPQANALFLALDHGGHCDGLALRIAAQRHEEETRHLWRREMITGSYAPTFIDVATPQGRLHSIAFVVDQTTSQYTPELNLDRQAELIALAAGELGRNSDYLFDVAERLRILEVDDPYVFELEHRVQRLLERNAPG
jgi:cation transport protein ChaC